MEKKKNIVPVHKRSDKQNYHPVSLFPICIKFFDWFIFNEMFTFFISNNLISLNQLNFRPGDSCINQLISITHKIYKSFLITD